MFCSQNVIMRHIATFAAAGADATSLQTIPALAVVI